MVETALQRALAEIAGADVTADQAALLREMECLGRTIADARAEIAALSVTEITGRHIPAATDELDAIISHTAAATDTILAACETLDTLAASLDAVASSCLQALTTTIYEACAFQDITGQRIMKVVAALKAIDAKVARIVAEKHQQPGALAASADPLASGPQLPTAAMGQADVDHLLASFG
jgi:chemotaxis protein CheZ